MKLELGKFEIKDIQFADKSYVENHVLYVNKEEVEALVVVETVPGVGSFPQEERTAADAQSAPTIRQSEIIFFIVNYPFE